MRAATYLRVSSDKQAAEGTIDSQRRDVPARCARDGWTIVREYVDDGASAATGNLDNRPGLLALLRDAEAGALSSDEPIVLSPADADRVVDLLAAQPGPTEAMRELFAASPAERRPCAGWVATAIGSLVLRRSDGIGSHAVVHGQVWRTATACGTAPTIEAAQLAAEDHLLAVRDEITRAVGR